MNDSSVAILRISDLAAFLWERKLLFVVLIFVAEVVAVGIAVYSDKIYEATAVVIPVENSQAGVERFAGSLGGLASLAGISVGVDSKRQESLAVLRSRAFVESFIEKHRLIFTLFGGDWDAENERWLLDKEDIPTIRDAYKKFVEDVITVNESPDSGTVSIFVRWTDRELAAVWANSIVHDVNAVLKNRTIDEANRSIDFLKDELSRASVVGVEMSIYSLIESRINTVAFANATEEYAFRLVDPAVVVDVDDHVWPSLVLLVILGIIVGTGFAFIVSIVLIWRRDYQSMANSNHAAV